MTRILFHLAGMTVLMVMLSACSSTKTVAPEPLTYVANQDMGSHAEQTPGPPNVSYKNVVLSNLDLNRSGESVTVKPGSEVTATLRYQYHCKQCYQSLNNQIIIGLANRSAQACIYNGGPSAEGAAEFKLKAPAKPGKYEIRFRGLQASDCQAALRAGWNADNSPSKSTTIGVITVSRKA